jgi:hypothetical protein
MSEVNLLTDTLTGTGPHRFATGEERAKTRIKEMYPGKVASLCGVRGPRQRWFAIALTFEEFQSLCASVLETDPGTPGTPGTPGEPEWMRSGLVDYGVGHPIVTIDTPTPEKFGWKKP